MAISKEKKAEILKTLKSLVKDSKSLVFVNFKNLSVEAANEMRRNLKDAGVKYLVAKKTLTRLALSESQAKGDVPDLPGELALAYIPGDSEDITAPAREINSFSEKSDGTLSILGGIFEGKFLNQGEMMEIATIPPLPVLHGKFVNIINSPIQRFAIALNEIAKKRA